MNANFSIQRFRPIMSHFFTRKWKAMLVITCTLAFLGSMLLLLKGETLGLETLEWQAFLMAIIAYSVTRAAFAPTWTLQGGRRLFLLPASNAEKFLAICSASALQSLLFFVSANVFLGFAALIMQAQGMQDFPTTARLESYFVFFPWSWPVLLGTLLFGISLASISESDNYTVLLLQMVGMGLTLALVFNLNAGSLQMFLRCLAFLICAAAWGLLGYRLFTHVQIKTRKS
jgi:hypothetical protein